MFAIVFDPVGDRLYFGGSDGIEVINVNGSSRTKLVDGITLTLTVDLKAG